VGLVAKAGGEVKMLAMAIVVGDVLFEFLRHSKSPCLTVKLQ
jgi:hypothetical protein